MFSSLHLCVFKKTGCRGCASGKDAGPRNIFGNKYGQSLAAVQVAREKRMEAVRVSIARMYDKHFVTVAFMILSPLGYCTQARQEERERLEEERKEQDAAEHSNDDDDGDGDSETDDETDDEDYGPTPAAGVWAGSQKLQEESEALAEGDEEGEPPSKRVKSN